MAVKTLLAVCIAISSLFTPIAESNSVTLSSLLSECEQKSFLLFCDFKNTQKDIYIEPLIDKEIKKVFVYNAKNVYMNDSMCVGVALQNIGSVTILSGPISFCSEEVELTVKTSTIDKLPKKVTKFYLEESTMHSLITDRNFTKLTVINSNIKDIEIKSPMNAEVTAVFQSTVVESLTKLLVGNTYILFLNTEIRAVNAEGLVLQENSKATFKNAVIKTLFENSITLNAGAKLTVENSTGIMSIMGALNSRIEVEFKDYPCRGYYSLFVVFLILFLISITVNIILLVYHLKGIKEKHRESRQAESTSKEVELEVITEPKDIGNKSEECQRQPLLLPSNEPESEPIDNLKTQVKNQNETNSSKLSKVTNMVEKLSIPLLQTKITKFQNILNEKICEKQAHQEKHEADFKIFAENLTINETKRTSSTNQENKQEKKAIAKAQAESLNIWREFNNEKIKLNKNMIRKYNELLEETHQIKKNIFIAWQEIIYSISCKIGCPLNLDECKGVFIRILEKYLSYMESKHCINANVNEATIKCDVNMSKEDKSVFIMQNLEELKNNQETYLDISANIFIKILDLLMLLITLVESNSVHVDEVAVEVGQEV